MRTHVGIAIQGTTKCNLRCVHCLGNDFVYVQKDRPHITPALFRDYTKKCTDFGISDFEITPIVGEFFNIPHWQDIIMDLDHNDLVRNFDLYTNYTITSPVSIDLMNTMKKLNLVISVHGWDRADFFAFTGRNLFDRFLASVNYLMHTLALNKNRSVTFRVEGEMPKVNRLAMMIRAMVDTDKVKLEQVKNYSNWGGMIPKGSFVDEELLKKRDGICEYAIYVNGIDSVGDMTLCSCQDINHQLHIGNISMGLDSIYSKKWVYDDSPYFKYLKMQNEGIWFDPCYACTEYKPISRKKLENAAEDIPILEELL
jgi:uncharacterized Fe-S cluster-containing radical SAM superfamily protein